MTLADIGAELGAAKSTVSLWVRNVEFVPKPRNRNVAGQRPHPFHLRRLADEAAAAEEAKARVGWLSERDLYLVGAALYAGEGSKTGRGQVRFANTNPRMVALYCRWMRVCFVVDETRFRVRLYLHDGLDLDAATEFWSRITAVPVDQFGKAYRPQAVHGIRNSKHSMGCATVVYIGADVMRAVLASVDALLSSDDFPG